MERTASGLTMLRSSSTAPSTSLRVLVVGVLLFLSFQCAGERVPVVLTGDDERNRGREVLPQGRVSSRGKS